MQEHVILVDENDNEIGTMEKMEAHRKGELHRAFSVLVFNSKGEMLLQKRAKAKYHSAGLWSNACCSHPKPGESIRSATKRRMKEELGIDIQPNFLYKFKYKVELENDLIEHEYDHVYVCQFDGEPNINKNEIEAFSSVSMDELKLQLSQSPQKYTYWLNLIVKEFSKHKKRS